MRQSLQTTTGQSVRNRRQKNKGIGSRRKPKSIRSITAQAERRRLKRAKRDKLALDSVHW